MKTEAAAQAEARTQLQLQARLIAVRDHLVSRGRRHALLDRGLAAIEAAPEHVRPRLLRAIVQLLPGQDFVSVPAAYGPICPAYPHASVELQARIALGEAPARVLRGLTPREAHEALCAGTNDPIAWVLRELPANCGARSLPVARWLAACYADPPRRAALERERVERGPGGGEIHGSLADRTDEITPKDLPHGVATSVNVAFARAAARMFARWEAGAELQSAPLAPQPVWWRPIRCARLLMSAQALVREGRDQKHCVGAYAPSVKSGQCVIVALCVRGHRSTVELTRQGEVRQHKGPGNKPPHPLCQRALAVCLRRWNLS